MNFLFFQLFSLAHLACASSIPHLHGRTGLPHQIPVQLQSLLCLLPSFSVSNLFQVNLQWRVQREKQLSCLQDPSKDKQLNLLCPFLLLQYQVSTLCNVLSLYFGPCLTIFTSETTSPSKEEVDIESMDVQIAVNQASKGLGSSANSTSSQPISNFFAPVGGFSDPDPVNFDDLFEETPFNLEQVVVLTHVPKEVDWSALKNHFSVTFGLLDLEYSALDKATNTCYLAFMEISTATAAKNYKGPLGIVDPTHSKKFIQPEFAFDLDTNLPYRVVLLGIEPGDTVEALSLKMAAVPMKIKLMDGRNFAFALFDVISEWCKVLDQQYFVVNNHTISIVDAIDPTNQAQFYRLFMGWVPRAAKHSQLIQVVGRISGHHPLHLFIMKDKKSNFSRGFAFLVVKTLQEKEALLGANEFPLKGCKCKFKEARPLKRAPKK